MSEIPKTFLVFKLLAKDVVHELLSIKDSEARKNQLLSHLDLPCPGIQREILLDFHFNNLTYCISSNFSEEKTSCLLEILKYCIDYSLENRLNEGQSFEIFKKLLLKHSVQRSPYSIAVFTIEELKKIIDYGLVTLFRHYSLFDYAFNPHCNLLLKNVTRFEGQFPVVLKLEEAGEIAPETIQALENYVIKAVVEESPRELGSEEEEALITDPLQYLLEKEMKSIRAELEEKIKKQDDEFLSKIEVFKK